MFHFAVLVLICFVSFILKIPYFKLPLDRDYGGHGYVAYCWLKGKGLPYRDILETKTPGLKIIYMIIIQWLGINRRAFRLFFALYNVFTTIAVYALGAQLFTPAAGLLAAGLYALYSSVPSLWWHFSNTESYYVLPTVLSFYCMACGFVNAGTAGLMLIAGAGLFGGISVMFKQPALINTVGPSLFYLLLFSPHKTLIDLCVYAAGCLIPVFAFIVYFVIIHKTPLTKTPFGATILDMTRTYLATPLFKASKGAIESNRKRFRTIFYDMCLIAIGGGAGTLLLLTHNTSHGVIVVLWIVLTILSAIISRTYLAYHFIPLVPPLCILTGMIFQVTGAGLFANGFHAMTPAAAVTVAAFAVPFLLFLYQLIKDLTMSSDLIGAFYSGEDALYALTEDVGKYIKANTTEDDYVYSWGHEPEIYFWSERRAPTFSIYPPVVNPSIFNKDRTAVEFAQLLTNLPKYFVLTSVFGEFRQFEELIIQKYVLEKKFDPYLYLFKLK